MYWILVISLCVAIYWLFIKRKPLVPTDALDLVKSEPLGLMGSFQVIEQNRSLIEYRLHNPEIFIRYWVDSSNPYNIEEQFLLKANKRFGLRLKLRRHQLIKWSTAHLHSDALDVSARQVFAAVEIHKLILEKISEAHSQ